MAQDVFLYTGISYILPANIGSKGIRDEFWHTMTKFGKPWHNLAGCMQKCIAINGRYNREKMQEALRNIKSRLNTSDIKPMKEISGAYATGMPFALGMSYDTMIKRFHNPGLLTIDDLLTISDISDTEVNKVIAVAIKEAKKNYIKRDITALLPDEDLNK